MSNTSKYMEGGVFVNWKIEKLAEMREYFRTAFSLKWPHTKDDFTISLSFTKAGENEVYIYLWVAKFSFTTRLIANVYVLSEEGMLVQLARDMNIYFTEKLKSFGHLLALERRYYLMNEGSLSFLLHLRDPSTNIIIHMEYYIFSVYTEQTFLLEWSVEGYMDWEKNGEYTEYSPAFPVNFIEYLNLKEPKMNLSLRKNGRHLFAITSWCSFDCGRYKYKLMLQSKDGSHKCTSKTKWCPISTDNLLTNISEEALEFCKKEFILNLMLTVVKSDTAKCEKITFNSSNENLPNSLAFKKNQRMLCYNLQQCIQRLYKDGGLCDVILQTKSQQFPCHKLVLCARSAVFKTMFENEMLEKETNVVNIEDIESEILGMFVSYLYSDKLDSKDFNAVVKLYEVADKYDVKLLLKDCSDVMTSRLSIENVSELLDVADKHNHEDLKEELVSYFCRNSVEIIKTRSWRNLFLNKPLLATETLQAALIARN